MVGKGFCEDVGQREHVCNKAHSLSPYVLNAWLLIVIYIIQNILELLILYSERNVNLSHTQFIF